MKSMKFNFDIINMLRDYKAFIFESLHQSIFYSLLSSQLGNGAKNKVITDVINSIKHS